ncbi:hypothetical protein COL11_26485 [Bacillus anthracis]|uniref:hypothetical protein n=1 Tax=Bacillus TaxID=1386 RepID=UPI000BF2B1A5|nr:MULTISPECIES: hypothetical protein [Bacillus]PEU75804.1 hypothetical protein CN394_26455 [Bacillus anthracis]MDE7551713.1 hypothetical protein [Bacillus tropicus]MDE7573622.1 hypothetical protein [Bacillus tropicus]PEZ71375.1 hypothetical protein CN410_22780 [Bacillus anthracis]PFW31793.1 hypothetical protein COL11_26485 [Bacillus anthracis]
MHNTLRILLLILGHIISSIRLLAGQHNFLSLSQFLLGALLFLIILGQIKKKDSGTGFFRFSSLLAI